MSMVVRFRLRVLIVELLVFSSGYRLSNWIRFGLLCYRLLWVILWKFCLFMFGSFFGGE